MLQNRKIFDIYWQSLLIAVTIYLKFSACSKMLIGSECVSIPSHQQGTSRLIFCTSDVVVYGIVLYCVLCFLHLVQHLCTSWFSVLWNCYIIYRTIVGIGVILRSSYAL